MKFIQLNGENINLDRLISFREYEPNSLNLKLTDMTINIMFNNSKDRSKCISMLWSKKSFIKPEVLRVEIYNN